MKIAFLYGQFSVGPRPIDLSALMSSKRGLTGSEISCFIYARAMAKRGHEVDMFLPISPAHGRVIDDVLMVPVTALESMQQSRGAHEVVYAWNEPDQLRRVRGGLRMINQQLNDFNYCRPDFDSFVDIYTSPSAIHRDYLLTVHPNPNPVKWEVIPNGCDPSLYDRTAKVPGRVLYASSPDRGLHRLLEAWPEIKRRVPHAHLRILYELQSWLKTMVGNRYPDPGIQECATRARFIELAIARMQHLDVTAVGSVSRNDMVREMSEAEVLAYPCDTIRFTEGFSVTTLEACAAGAIPVINYVDALPEIYGETTSFGEHRPYADRVVDALANDAACEMARKRAYKIAERHSWPVLAEQLESMIERRLARLSHPEGYESRSGSHGDSPESLPIG